MTSTNGNDRQQPVTMDHLRSRKQPSTARVWVSMDSEIDVAYRDAQAAEGMAELMLSTGVTLQETDTDEYQKLVVTHREAKAKLQEAEATVKADAVEFKFRSIGRKRFDALVADYPPTDADRKRVEDEGGNADNLQWSLEEFPPALMAECVLKPKLTLADFTEIWVSEDWEEPTLAALFQAALSVQGTRRVVEAGNV